MNAYHRISMLMSAKQAPAEYMSGGETHLTDYDPESEEYGDARYERQQGEAPPKEMVDSWVAMHNSGVRTMDIARGSGYPFYTVDNEIAKHPSGKGSVLTTIRLTEDLAGLVDVARGDEPTSRFLLKLLETAVSEPGYAKAASGGINPAPADVSRWLRMRERGLSNSQIAEAVGRHPRYISDAIGSSRSKTKKTKSKGKKVSVRMPLWLKNMLDAAADAAGITRVKLQQMLIGRALEPVVA